MDSGERDEILYRLDERTERIDGHLDRLDRRLRLAEEQLDEHEARIQANEQDLTTIDKATKGIGALVIASISGLFAKLSGFL